MGNLNSEAKKVEGKIGGLCGGSSDSKDEDEDVKKGGNTDKENKDEKDGDGSWESNIEESVKGWWRS